MKHKQNWNRLGKNLTTLIIIVTVALFFYVYKPQKQTITESVETSKIVSNIDTTEHHPLKIKSINPNSATKEELQAIGLSSKQAQSCINYRNKGGKFYKCEDILKIYTITADDYERIKQYLYVPQQMKTSPKNNVEQKDEKIKKEKTIHIINLNTCDTNDLKQLPKIGSYRAKKIIEQRNKLGGFYSLSQLYSIYSIDSITIENIKNYLIIHTEEINKININTATFKEINAHPLISYEETKNIFNYKKIVGTISSIEELRNNNIVTEEEYKILKFYIKTSE